MNETRADGSAPSAAVLPGQRVTLTRRIFGDYLLESVLFFSTFVIGWFVWLAIVAPQGQTPAKQLLKVRIHDFKSGRVASAGQVWSREILGKFVFPWLVISVLGGIFAPNFYDASLFLIEGFRWLGITTALFNADRRALWDFHAGTVLRHHPLTATTVDMSQATSLDEALKELDELWGAGEITSEQYSTRRRELRGAGEGQSEV